MKFSKIMKLLLICSLICVCIISGAFLRIFSSGNTEYHFPLNKDAAGFQGKEAHTAEKDSLSDSWNLLLVNPWNSIPEDYSVELGEIEDGHEVDKRIIPDLELMLDKMRSEGLSPFICSAYRTWETQQRLFENKVEEYIYQGYSQREAEKEAGKWVAVPGTSEHQAGLALDIVDTAYQLLDVNQEYTDVQKWLIKNSWKYGFILRYPSDKSDITGISFEPWHYRYVGKEAAKEIYEKGLCLEEYLSEN